MDDGPIRPYQAERGPGSGSSSIRTWVCWNFARWTSAAPRCANAMRARMTWRIASTSASPRPLLHRRFR